MRITFLTWRDCGHPDGGGSEVYVEQIAIRLARDGHEVTIRCAQYDGAPRDEEREGVRFERRGRRLTVYPRGLAHLLTTRGRRQEVVVDVINGLPFGATLVRRRGVLALIHHVHERQWRIIYPGLAGRLGWLVESRLVPLLYRNVVVVTVSQSSRDDLVRLGFDPRHLHVVRNGLTAATDPTAPISEHPRLVVLSRLVPHKQIEHALHVVAALRGQHPGLRLDLIGSGWWEPQIRRAAHELGIEHHVVFHGHLDDGARDRVLAGAWLALLPSAKEGWGLAVLEAAAQGTPTIGYADAGGLRESILHDVSGILVDGQQELTRATGALLLDRSRRAELSAGAKEYASRFDWEESTQQFAAAARSAQRAPYIGMEP